MSNNNYEMLSDVDESAENINNEESSNIDSADDKNVSKDSSSNSLSNFFNFKDPVKMALDFAAKLDKKAKDDEKEAQNEKNPIWKAYYKFKAALRRIMANLIRMYAHLIKKFMSKPEIPPMKDIKGINGAENDANANLNQAGESLNDNYSDEAGIEMGPVPNSTVKNTDANLNQMDESLNDDYSDELGIEMRPVPKFKADDKDDSIDDVERPNVAQLCGNQVNLGSVLNTPNTDVNSRLINEESDPVLNSLNNEGNTSEMGNGLLKSGGASDETFDNDLNKLNVIGSVS